LACRKALGRKASRPGELNVIFTTNREIRRINKRYLRHDRNTDVIAFPYPQTLSEKSTRPHGPFGDVFVSVDQARIQARELDHSLLEELLTLAIHGTLHLMGYDDHAPKARQRMFAKQSRILRGI
jgi:probable rRNA maturation factor